MKKQNQNRGKQDQKEHKPEVSFEWATFFRTLKRKGKHRKLKLPLTPPQNIDTNKNINTNKK